MTAIRTLALVLFAFGGYLNATYASLGGPANLIIIGAVLCIALSVAQVATLRAKVGPLGPLLIIALAFGYGIAAADTFSLYGGTKLGLLLTLTPLSFLVGAWLVDTEKRRVWLAAGVAGWGFATVLVQQLSPDQTLADVGRLAGEDLSYQALSRAAAASAVVFAVFALASRFRTRWRLAGFVTALSFAAVAIGGGSRGPLIGLVIAVTVVAFRTRAGAWLGAGAVLAAWYLLPILLLPFVPDRVFSIEDSSTRVRADAASLAIDHIRENFLGTGFGSLEYVVAPAGPTALYYPHNVVLEVAAEAGILAAAVFIGVIAYLSYRLWKHGTTTGDTLTLALLVYFFVNALVSGDINSNRGLWLFLGVASAAVFALRNLPPVPETELAREKKSADLTSGSWAQRH